MPYTLQRPERSLLLPLSFGFDEDFLEFVSGDLFTDTSADSGAAVAITDAAGGVVTLTTGGTNNNECALHTTKELFKFAADKPAFYESRAQYAEANTDDANIYHGWLDAYSADCMVDDGVGPKSSASGAGFYKVDGGTRWYIFASLGSTQTKVELTAANSLDNLAKTAGGSSYQVFRVEFRPYSSTQAELLYWIDGVLVYKISDFTFTSATEMHAGAIAKAGGSNSEVLSVDYISVWQKR